MPGLVLTFTVVPTAPAKWAGVRSGRSRPGAADLEGVVAVDRVVLVEGPGDGAGQAADGVDVGAARGVDQHLEHAAGQVEVVQIEVSVGHEGRDEVPDAVDRRRHRIAHLLLS